MPRTSTPTLPNGTPSRVHFFVDDQLVRTVEPGRRRFARSPDRGCQGAMGRRVQAGRASGLMRGHKPGGGGCAQVVKSTLRIDGPFIAGKLEADRAVGRRP